MSESSRTVLISGAGIAGPVVASWLGKKGIRATLVERAQSIRTNGQTIDIKGIARDIVKKMGLEPAIRAACTEEAGLYFVDEQDKVLGTFGVDGPGLTSDIEILRYKLADIFYEDSKDSTEYIFGDFITNITQSEEKVTIDLNSGKTRSFDVVVLCDGQSSRTRSMVFPRGEEEGVRYVSLGVKTAFYSIPGKMLKDDWSRAYWTTKGRNVLMRPDYRSDEVRTRVFLNTMSKEADELFEGYTKLDMTSQKRLWTGWYDRAGWNTPQLLKGLEETDDFYMTDIAQVRSSKWHKGRVVMVGDTAYCPSGLTGMGTSAAITGAFVLAQELARRPSWTELSDVTSAFEDYDRKCRPYIENAQSVSKTLVSLLYPESVFGVRVLRYVVGAVSFIVNSAVFKGISSIVGRLTGSKDRKPDEKIDLSEYF
ncbi:hypothetical protein OC846_002881 [Tilletia horrida]|uniref:FAD-binding domain-containing protein n=1 Tax=Tilletia horrida TaxID=155126 RepID=A0AAN6GRE4_9BASI|nr:hypothetical protein OC845_002076 [Tilletia horrida]KAK0552477.1 hypothetical protein OC846_002881 [Tilletia horrida]KAK0561101.1 hypothetical protein OC861_005974 [Tilletia horrida]